MPIWVGGNSEAAYRRTARFGDALHAAFEPVADVRAAWTRVQELAEREGRDPATLGLSVRAVPRTRKPLCLRPVPFRRVGPRRCSTRSAEWREIGVSHVLLDPVASGVSDGRTRAMEHFMTDVRTLGIGVTLNLSLLHS